ncbi:hypothetical protein [Streptomyces sp. SID10815]|uniref:hypothetical protein n=1 Tax=Streptomyces sp. SID10815 TaxID=2706027 RepID=UPI0013CDAB19|nr:hypothetical protein [Streptomyces sp. SID10815]NEA45206.1 hypothetical protein [Streptomyces sp. SID10815]NEA51939.1 hypothetical protein [Streptomyces sp. SID10815]
MIFRFTVDSANGSVSLTAEPVVLRSKSDDPQQTISIRISPRRAALYIPLDRIEELLTGIRNIVGQAHD